jgi:Protein of unknown function (DUF1236)
MRKEKLLLAVAAIALLAGTSAFAQQENRTAPAEKSAPSTMGKPSSGAQQPSRSEPRASQPGRAETTGQAPQEHPGAAGRAEENKAGQNKPGQNAPERANRSDRERPSGAQNERRDREDRSHSTTGQAPQATPNERRNENVQPDRERVQGREENRTTTNEGRGSASVNLSTEQRSRIHEVLVKERGAPRVAHVDFSLNVGTPVPRSVKIVRVPSTIVEIQPAWRDFEYFMVGDQIVIVDPRSMEIVAVIAA